MCQESLILLWVNFRDLYWVEAQEKLTLEAVVINDQGFLEFTEHNALSDIYEDNGFM